MKDLQLTASCQPGPGRGPTPANVLCGDYAVNTIQPTYQPFRPNTALSVRLPPQTGATIGDRLSAARVDWAWYSGGWSNANGDVNATRVDERNGDDVRGHRNHRRRRLPELPAQAVPVPPPAVQLLRELCARHGGAGRASSRRGRIPPACPLLEPVPATSRRSVS